MQKIVIQTKIVTQILTYVNMIFFYSFLHIMQLHCVCVCVHAAVYLSEQKGHYILKLMNTFRLFADC